MSLGLMERVFPERLTLLLEEEVLKRGYCHERDFSLFHFSFQKHLYSFTDVIHRPEDKIPLSYLILGIAKTLSWDKPISYLWAEYHSIYFSYMFHDPWAVQSYTSYPPIG